MDQTTNSPAQAPVAEPALAVTPMFTPEQSQSLADHLVNTGVLTPEQAAANLAADGVTPKAQPTPEQAEYDKNFPRAQSIKEYEMPSFAGVDSKVATAADRAAREWLYTAGFDRGRGSSLLREVDRVAAQHAKMNEAERAIYQKTERLRLERVWGDKTTEKIKLAGQLVRELEAARPGLMEILDQGPGNSATVITLLAAQAEILRNRPGRK